MIDLHRELKSDNRTQAEDRFANMNQFANMLYGAMMNVALLPTKYALSAMGESITVMSDAMDALMRCAFAPFLFERIAARVTQGDYERRCRNFDAAWRAKTHGGA
jgi:hypothetical protein